MSRVSSSYVQPITIVTWNVNSLRSAMRRGFCDWLAATTPDIVCLQEVRALADQLHPLESSFPGYRSIWHPAVRAGYAGVAILSRFEPLGIERGLDGDDDPQGRALTLDFGSFRVGSFYAPNATPGTEKILIKRTWLARLRSHVMRRSDKPFFIAGDLNVAYTAQDSGGVSRPFGINGCTDEERQSLRELMEGCRLYDPMREGQENEVLSTWWPLSRPRSMRNGIRFDYILAGEAHRKYVADSVIHLEVRGSDHCPVRLSMHVPSQNLRRTQGRGQIRLM